MRSRRVLEGMKEPVRKLTFGEEETHDAELMLGREWLVTNVLGGFASGGLAGGRAARRLAPHPARADDDVLPALRVAAPADGRASTDRRAGALGRPVGVARRE